MSDSVKCDGCGALGRRRTGRMSPEGWFFLESKDEEGPEVFIVYACSEACRDGLWQKGPGKLDLTLPEVKLGPTVWERLV